MTHQKVTSSSSSRQVIARKTWRRRILEALALTLLLGLSVEIALRIFMATRVGVRAMLYGTPAFRQEISVAREKDKEWRGPRGVHTNDATESPSAHTAIQTGYSKYFPNEIKVDVDDAGVRFSYRLNRHGFRGPEFDITKAPNVIRIVTLGASSTYGFGLRDQETYAQQLQDRLNEECRTSNRFEVINLGVPHLTSRMILALFLAEGLALKPDFVTFYEGINDASTSPGAVLAENIRNASRSNWLMNEAYYLLIPLYRSIRDRSMFLLVVDNAIQTSSRSTLEQVKAHRSPERVTHYLENLRAIRDAAAANGAKFIAVSQQVRLPFPENRYAE